MRTRIADFRKPFPLDKMTVRGADGRHAEGELIMLPYLPSELLALSGKEAVDLVQSAVDLAAARGAQVVGLGGFSSIICYGGNALEQRSGVTVTSGNSLTTWAALHSIEAACASRGVNIADATVAIVGANGAIGHALSLLFAERAGELILVGNPRNPEGSERKLRRVAADCRRHVGSLAAGGREFAPATLAGEIVSKGTSEKAAKSDLETRISITTDIDQQLPRAHIVLTATKAVLPFISSRHLRNGAMVCDVSRPFNVAPEVFRRRADLQHVSGGLIKAPDYLRAGLHRGARPRKGAHVLCRRDDDPGAVRISECAPLRTPEGTDDRGDRRRGAERRVLGCGVESADLVQARGPLQFLRGVMPRECRASSKRCPRDLKESSTSSAVGGYWIVRLRGR